MIWMIAVAMISEGPTRKEGLGCRACDPRAAHVLSQVLDAGQILLLREIPHSLTAAHLRWTVLLKYSFCLQDSMYKSMYALLSEKAGLGHAERCLRNTCCRFCCQI